MSKRVVPMIHVPDVRATVDWYQQIGFNIDATYGDETGEGSSFAVVSFGETGVMFDEGGATSTNHRREVDLYVYTNDVDDLYARLKDSVDVVHGPNDTFYGMREVIIRDLNGFWITFGQESVFSVLMSGVSKGEAELVRKAVEGGTLSVENLSIALAFASAGNKPDEIVEILKNAGAMPPPNISLETLKSYAGKYKGEHGFEVEITLRDGKLFATSPGQQPISLWPLDQITFKPIAIQGATLIFNVGSLTFQQDEHKMELKRI